MFGSIRCSRSDLYTDTDMAYHPLSASYSMSRAYTDDMMTLCVNGLSTDGGCVGPDVQGHIAPKTNQFSLSGCRYIFIPIY